MGIEHDYIYISEWYPQICLQTLNSLRTRRGAYSWKENGGFGTRWWKWLQILHRLQWRRRALTRKAEDNYGRTRANYRRGKSYGRSVHCDIRTSKDYCPWVRVFYWWGIHLLLQDLANYTIGARNHARRDVCFKVWERLWTKENWRLRTWRKLKKGVRASVSKTKHWWTRARWTFVLKYLGSEVMLTWVFSEILRWSLHRISRGLQNDKNWKRGLWKWDNDWLGCYRDSSG